MEEASNVIKIIKTGFKILLTQISYTWACEIKFYLGWHALGEKKSHIALTQSNFSTIKSNSAQIMSVMLLRLESSNNLNFYLSQNLESDWLSN